MNTMTEDQIGRLVLKQLGGRSFITIYEAIALAGVALAEQGRLGDAAVMGVVDGGVTASGAEHITALGDCLTPCSLRGCFRHS